MSKLSYSGYRFPPEIIQQAIWLYLRFTLSLRDVEDLLAERGVAVHATIDNFTAGIGANHDSIQIALGDFGSYAALSSSMAQLGSDVVIRLGATDSITLNDVHLSSLAAANFKFV
jgi:hypothetical protein